MPPKDQKRPPTPDYDRYPLINESIRMNEPNPKFPLSKS